MRKNKTIYTITLIFLLLGMVLGVIGCEKQIEQNLNLENSAKKVILFIGDGMGENHIKNSEIYLEKEMIFSSFEKQGYMTTNSMSLNVPTDSAAAGTALATGKKTYNNYVGKYFNKDIKSISELAKENGLGVGIVTTDTLSGATPSAFSAHTTNRNYESEIILSQLENDIDLYLGAGNTSYKKYKSSFESKGYEFISEYSELKMTDKKVIGSFDKINNYTSTQATPTLPLLTLYAIEYMEQNFPDGYFLMIEGAHIDKMSHNNKILDMISYLDEFNNSIELAYDMLDGEDICFIVTADHETGGLTLAATKNEIQNELYTSQDHTTAKVKFYIHHFNNSDITKISDEIDNTDIFKICTQLLGI